MEKTIRYFLIINFYLTPTLAAGLFEDHKPFYRFSRKQFCPLTAYFFIKANQNANETANQMQRSDEICFEAPEINMASE